MPFVDIARLTIPDDLLMNIIKLDRSTVLQSSLVVDENTFAGRKDGIFLQTRTLQNTYIKRD